MRGPERGKVERKELAQFQDETQEPHPDRDGEAEERHHGGHCPAEIGAHICPERSKFDDHLIGPMEIVDPLGYFLAHINRVCQDMSGVNVWSPIRFLSWAPAWEGGFMTPEPVGFW